MNGKLALSTFDISEGEVQSRFDWAAREGNPLWLWPETQVTDWQEALVQFERIAREVLSEGRATESLAGRANDIGIAGYTSGMGPLLGYWIEQGLLKAEQDIAAVLKLHYKHNSARMARMAERTAAVVERLALHGVDVTILKGMHTAFSVFPNAGTRPLSDIDLLINPGNRAIAGDVLLSLGYLPGVYSRFPDEQCWRNAGSATVPRTLALVHRDDPWHVDLHFSLNRRYRVGAPIIELDPVGQHIAKQGWALSPDGDVLTPPATVLFLACHASCGFENLTMIRLVEIAMVVNTSRLFWSELVELAELTGTLASCYPALCLTEALVPGTVPPWVLQRCEAQTPAAVRNVVRRLRPANAQRVVRWTFSERFMWTGSLKRLSRQLLHDLVPVRFWSRDLIDCYRTRLYKIGWLIR